MKKAMFLILVIGSMLKAEIPQISLEKPVKDAKIIISAVPVRSAIQDMTIHSSYAIWSFKIDKVYKGEFQHQLPSVDLEGMSESNEIMQGKFLNVLVFSYPSGKTIPHSKTKAYIQSFKKRASFEILPRYEIGKKYILFLSEMMEDCLYIRVDKYSLPKEYDKEGEQQVKAVIKRLKDFENGKPTDFIDYQIPKKAKAVSRKASGNYGASDIIEYLLGDEKVGKRGFWKNSKMAFDTPMKYGMRYGISRTCDEKGNKWRLETFLDDAQHGVLRTWDENGQLTEGYYIYGQYVSKDEYLEKCKSDIRLEQSLKLNWIDFEETKSTTQN
ncbi:MAG: hypothetical protein A2Y10_02260 [Planctomycetes bacterium GWF2_41_51]|nr:MAG: hypothetical protein A2Y10_02260 [Planctomycetes bacterium GWF2_41_51]HBG25768.1 hypothetical protein [Phycisphaerales bacterium]